MLRSNSLVRTILLLTLLVLPLLFLNQRAAAAPQADPLAFYDPDDTGWLSYRNQSYNSYVDTFNDIKDDYILLDIEVDVVNGQRILGSVWQSNPNHRAWKSHSTLTDQQFSDLWTQYGDDGYRLVDQEAFVLDGEMRYSGVWHKNDENFSWLSYRNATSNEFSDNFDLYKDDFMMIDFDIYLNTNGEHRLSAAWVENAENLNWKMRRAMDAVTFDTWLSDNEALGYRPLKVDSYTVGNEQRYGAILVENSNGRTWSIFRDMTGQGYLNRWYQMRDLGLRPIDFERYVNEDGNVRYAGVWRQDGDRYDWFLRDEVDTMVLEQFNDFDIPGMSVAIAKGGEFKYIRGFGHADVEAGKWYNSRTVNRLASVSKAIGGVLLMEMLEDGTFDDVNDLTRDYVPSFPVHHTHTIGQLVSNRGGIGHYAELGWPANTSIQHTSALSGAQLFQNDALEYVPGAGCLYSTHTYNFFGAAAEAASGKFVGQLLADEITDPLDLGSLKVENRANYNYHRTQLYNSSNDEIGTPDNISWKIFGGGLEASAYDLGRFGIKLLNGSLLSQASLDTLWTPPDNCNNYAYGWNVGEEEGTQVVAKNGAQSGARTYIRMYPEKDIVIVVLTNRSGGGHSATQLGRDLGALMLENEPDIAVPVVPAVLMPPSDGSAPTSPAVKFAVGDDFYLPQGPVQLVTTVDGLVLSNIGDTGESGMLVELQRPTELFSAEFTPAVQVGNVISQQIAIDLLDANGRSVSQLGIELPQLAAPPWMTDVIPTLVTPSYPTSEPIVVEFIQQGRIIATKSVGPDEPVSLDIGHGWECEIVESQGIAFETCKPVLKIKHCNADETECIITHASIIDLGWQLEFAEMQEQTDPTGNVMRFDAVRIGQRGTSRLLAPPVEQISLNVTGLASMQYTPANYSVPTAVTLSSSAVSHDWTMWLATLPLLFVVTLLVIQTKRTNRRTD